MLKKCSYGSAHFECSKYLKPVIYQYLKCDAFAGVLKYRSAEAANQQQQKSFCINISTNISCFPHTPYFLPNSILTSVLLLLPTHTPSPTQIFSLDKLSADIFLTCLYQLSISSSISQVTPSDQTPSLATCIFYVGKWNSKLTNALGVYIRCSNC